MNQHEIHLDNIEQVDFPYVYRNKKHDRWSVIEKKSFLSYVIISIPWFLHNFFALFSIKETIWWQGETWSIDRELSVPIPNEIKRKIERNKWPQNDLTERPHLFWINVSLVDFVFNLQMNKNVRIFN